MPTLLRVLFTKFFNKIIADGTEQVQAGVATKDVVITVCINLLTEHLASLYISFAHLGKVAEVYVVVGCAMNKQKVATKVARSRM